MFPVMGNGGNRGVVYQAQVYPEMNNGDRYNKQNEQYWDRKENEEECDWEEEYGDWNSHQQASFSMGNACRIDPRLQKTQCGR